MNMIVQSPVKGIISITIFILVALCSGFIGGIYSQQITYPLEIRSQIPNIIQQPSIKNAEKTLGDLYLSMAPLTVSVIRKTKTSWISQADIRSYGVILTSDGWIATVIPPQDQGKDLEVLHSNGTVTPVLKQITDPALPLSFIQIDAHGMQSADFIGDASYFKALDAVAFMPPDNLQNILLARRQYPRAAQRQDIVRSSDTLEKTYLIRNAGLLGTPFFSKQGQLVGITGPLGLIPAEYIQDSLKKLLKRGAIERIKLGISYIDLSYPIGGDLLRRSGARVTSDKPINLSTVKGVELLVDGDIILKVNDEDINENRSLSEILSDYNSEDQMQLTVQRISGRTDLVTLQK